MAESMTTWICPQCETVQPMAAAECAVCGLTWPPVCSSDDLAGLDDYVRAGILPLAVARAVLATRLLRGTGTNHGDRPLPPIDVWLPGVRALHAAGELSDDEVAAASGCRGSETKDACPGHVELTSLPKLLSPAWMTESGTDAHGPWAILVVRGQQIKMRRIPLGRFEMGSNRGDQDERPVHTVDVTRHFWLSDTPITQDVWQAVMGDNPSKFKTHGNRPVEQVSWIQCHEFTNRINAMLPGLRSGLPTEAQWEYACRAGTSGNYAGDPAEMAWTKNDAHGQTQIVRRKKPNAWGLYDMHGNVWEWCSDWFGPYASGLATDPTGPATGTLRITRGGSAYDGLNDCRSSYRTWGAPEFYFSFLGFRLAAPCDV